MRQVISLLAEAIHALDCDIVLVTGRPSRLPTVADMLVELMPVTPDRLVPMHRYRVGTWYPFRAKDNLGIDDPKSTVVVGAMLCILAEGQIENFSLDTRRLLLKSTARYVGEMELTGQILDDKLIFQDLDLDKKATQAPASAADAAVRADAHRLSPAAARALDGEPALQPEVRQSAARVEPAEAVHRDPRARRVRRRPRLTSPSAPGESARQDRRGRSRRSSRSSRWSTPRAARCARSDVVLRLQTLGSDDAYWLDTGILAVR